MENKSQNMFELFRGFIAIVIAIFVAFIFILLCADDPGKALECLLIKPIISDGALNVKSILTILGRMTPIIFTGLAVCVMFSANQFNLGGEGAVMLGGFIAALIAIYVPMAAGVHAVVAVIVGTIAGGLVMLIPAIIKVKLKASEMVCSLMMNYVIMYIILHFLNNVFPDRSKGTTQTYPFLETAMISKMVPTTELTWGFIIAIIATVLVAIFMHSTRWGYSIRMIGINESFSKYSGMKVGGVIVLSQVIGGMLAGMGGSIE
ncbi:MAG: ABC transporter permease, partial [Anaerotignum sp.]